MVPLPVTMKGSGQKRLQNSGTGSLNEHTTFVDKVRMELID